MDIKQKCKNYLNMLQSTKNLSDKTIEAYASDLRDFGTFLADGEVDKEAVLAYVQNMAKERKLRDSTIGRRLVVLKQFFRYLYKQQEIEVDVFQDHAFRYKKERRLLTGLPCVGKTTVAYEILKNHSEFRRVTELDIIRTIVRAVLTQLDSSKSCDPKTIENEYKELFSSLRLSDYNIARFQSNQLVPFVREIVLRQHKEEAYRL